MLNEDTRRKLQELKLKGMLESLEIQKADPTYKDLSLFFINDRS